MDSNPPNPNPKILSSSWADKVRVSCSKSRFALKNVKHNLVGDIPKILVPPELIASTSNKWERCLVGFFPGSFMPFHAVKAIANRVWGLHGLVQVFASDGFFVFRFTTEDGLLEVLQNGPWMFGGKAFILLKWNPTFVFNKKSIKSVPVWAKLHGLPLSLWTEEGLSFIASIIGMPIACDKATHEGTRLAYARVCVQLEAAKKPTHFFDLVTTLSEEPIRIKVEYEWKPKRCPTCCVFGHNCTAEKLEAPKQGGKEQNACEREDGQNGKISKAWIPVKKSHGHGKDKSKLSVTCATPPTALVEACTLPSTIMGACDATISNTQNDKQEMGLASGDTPAERMINESSNSLIPTHVDPTLASVNTSCSMEKCISSFSNAEGPTMLLHGNYEADRPICVNQSVPAMQNNEVTLAHGPRDSLSLDDKDMTLACLAPGAHMCPAIDKTAYEYASNENASDETAANVVGPMCPRQSHTTLDAARVNPFANKEQHFNSSDNLTTANDNSMDASDHVNPITSTCNMALACVTDVCALQDKTLASRHHLKHAHAVNAESEITGHVQNTASEKIATANVKPAFVKKGFLNNVKPYGKDKAVHGKKKVSKSSLSCIEDCYSALWEDDHNDNLALVLSKLSDFENNMGPDYSDEDYQSPYLSQTVCGFNTEASVGSLYKYNPLTLDTDTDFTEGSSDTASEASCSYPRRRGKARKAKCNGGRKPNH